MACGPLVAHCVVPIDESESELGQVLLIGGCDGQMISSAAYKVDLATGVCTPLPSLLSHSRQYCTGARLPDGRVVCVGRSNDAADGITAEVFEPPQQGQQGNTNE
jgi:hypothetical protein